MTTMSFICHKTSKL